VVRLPGSDLDSMVLPKMDSTIDCSDFPAVQLSGSSLAGIGVDREQNVWGIAGSPPIVTRVRVDVNGNMGRPNLTAPPQGNNKCPAGDTCNLKDNSLSDPFPYTYSDFTGFGLRNFTRPAGSYSYVFQGCSGVIRDTAWYQVVWDADVPPNTTLTVRARTGKSPFPDASWGPWSNPFTTSPADLRTGMPLQPFDKDDSYLQVQWSFATLDKNAAPKLKSFGVGFKCGDLQ
jgi:hypothetical protein